MAVLSQVRIAPTVSRLRAHGLIRFGGTAHRTHRVYGSTSAGTAVRSNGKDTAHAHHPAHRSRDPAALRWLRLQPAGPRSHLVGERGVHRRPWLVSRSLS